MTDATSDADPTTDADPTADAEAGTEEQPQPFQNRAARRSKGKATVNHTGGTANRAHGRSGTVPSPRQYGNRRSG